MTGKRLTKNIRVEITQDDIDAGVRHDSYKCMMGLAATRAIKALNPAVRQIRALAGHVLASEPVDDAGVVTRSVGWALTDTATKRIKAFDRGDKIKPFVTIIRGV